MTHCVFLILVYFAEQLSKITETRVLLQYVTALRLTGVKHSICRMCSSDNGSLFFSKLRGKQIGKNRKFADVEAVCIHTNGLS